MAQDEDLDGQDTGADDVDAFADELGMEGDEDDEQDEAEVESAVNEAAQAVQFVVLPVACINEGKGAPLAMGIQRWWAQELAARGAKAAAPVFTALAERQGRKIPALMIFREPWTDERVIEGIGRFPNASKGLVVDMRVADDENVAYVARLVAVDDGALRQLDTWSFEGNAERLPADLHGGLRRLAGHFDVQVEQQDWQSAFSTKEHQAVVSFLVGLGNLSALQGRCVPTTPQQLLTPFVDALGRDPGMDGAMQGLHMMVDILVSSPVDQTAIPLSLQALNLAAQRRKNDASAFHHLGVLFRRLGDLPSAAQVLNQAFNLDPKNPAVTLAFIDALRAGNDIDNALRVAQFAVENGNESPAVLAQLGALMLEGEQFDEAEPFLRRAVEEGQVPSAYGDLANVLWERATDAEGEHAREDRDEALGLLRTAVELPGRTVAQSTLDMLLDLHEEHGLEEATLLLLKAAELHPTSATVLRYVASMYIEGDDPEKARPHLERMLGLPRRSLDDDAFARRGMLTLSTEDFDERYEKAIEQVRSSDAGAQTEAARFLREIIAKEPRYWQPHLMLALAVRETEGNESALAHLMDAVRLRPNDVEIRNLIAAILRKQGRAKEAVDHLRAVVALNPRAVDPVVNLAGCMRDANMFDEARQVCQAALQMLPNNPDFKRILESLPPAKA